MVGESKLYFSVWESPIVCVAWKMVKTLGHRVDNESIPLKIICLCFKSLSSSTYANQCFPLRRAYLFIFLLSHPLLIKAPIREHLRHFYALLLIDIEYDCIWIFFAMNYNVQSALGL